MKKYLLMLAALSLSACTIEVTSQEGHSCENAECSGGLYCNPDLICVSMKLGESCKNYRCGDGLKCNAQQICEEEVGATAKKGESCKDIECASGLFCNLDNICVYAQLGESCKKAECDTGLTCNDSKICEDASGHVTKAKKGESCNDTEDCVEGLICDGDEEKTCQEEDDDACLTNLDCDAVAGYICNVSKGLCELAGAGVDVAPVDNDEYCKGTCDTNEYGMAENCFLDPFDQDQGFCSACKVNCEIKYPGTFPF